jgi:geranylgeranylglycerol-phosphate geranylgeranyltransferase
MGRPLTSILVGLGVLAASVAGVGTLIINYALPVLLGTIVGFVFGLASNSLNDYLDRDIDEVNHPERLIPSGLASARAVLSFSIVMFGLGIVVAGYLSTYVGYVAFILVILAFILQILYEAEIKKVKIVGNITIGVQTMLAFIFGGVIVKAGLTTIVMAGASFLAIVAREIVKDVEDIKGDFNRKSLPKIIGIRKSNVLSSLMIMAAIVISIMAYYPLKIFGLTYLIIVLGADFLFLYSITIIFQNSKKARITLKFAMLLALIAFVIGGIFS